jgi:hypothetical protein
MKEIKVNPLREIFVVISPKSAIFGIGAFSSLFGNYSLVGDSIFMVSLGNREMILFIL